MWECCALLYVLNDRPCTLSKSSGAAQPLSSWSGVWCKVRVLSTSGFIYFLALLSHCQIWLVAAALFGRTHCSRVALISSSQTLLSRCNPCEQVARLHKYRGSLQWPDAALTLHIK